jgi:hypothetical protein
VTAKPIAMGDRVRLTQEVRRVSAAANREWTVAELVGSPVSGRPGARMDDGTWVPLHQLERIDSAQPANSPELDWWVMHGDGGFEWYDSEDEARSSLAESFAEIRQRAEDDSEWPEDIYDFGFGFAVTVIEPVCTERTDEHTEWELRERTNPADVIRILKAERDAARADADSLGEEQERRLAAEYRQLVGSVCETLRIADPMGPGGILDTLRVRAEKAETDIAEERAKRERMVAEVEWRLGPDAGVSSSAIWSVMTGISDSFERWRATTTPCDPSDFGRCHRLLEMFPEWRARMPEVVEAHPEWRGLVAAWDELTALYLEELPSGRAPRLRARLREVTR